MPSLRKRAYEEVSGDKAETPKKDTPRETTKEPSMLQRIRSMWQFANLYQWIMLFGKAIKMDDDFDIEVRDFRAMLCSVNILNPVVFSRISKPNA
jgi:hypothetical protein